MLENQIALVTGASRGIGKSIAIALASEGATVVGTATTKDGAASISEYLVAAGTRGRGMVLDVRDGAQIEALIAEIEKVYGGVSILVNNAGIAQDNLAMRMKESEWDIVIDTNLKSVFRLSKAVLRRSEERRVGKECRSRWSPYPPRWRPAMPGRSRSIFRFRARRPLQARLGYGA